MGKISRATGKVITKVFGPKIAYYCKYPIDRKAMLRELRKGAEQESIKKQLQESSKIAILFIGTNKYIEFFPDFYESVKKYFLTKTSKDFFVFTDMVDYEFLKGKKDVVVVKVEHQKWPFSTLMRFKMMSRVSSKLQKYSHIIYIDADMYANLPVTEEEFFSHDKPLFGVKHDSYVNKPGEYEFDTKSTAAVSLNDDISDYCVGAFWGGQSQEIIKMIKELEKRIDIDLKNGVIAKWHDESQMNKYFIENKTKVRILDPSYSYPELKPIPKPFKKRFVHTLHAPTKTATANRNEPNNPYAKSSLLGKETSERKLD